MQRFNLPGAVTEAVVAHEVAKESMDAQEVVNTTKEPNTVDLESSAAGKDTKTATVNVYAESQSGSRSSIEDDLDKVDERFQHGVQMAQAMTQVWTRNHLILAFAL